MSPHGLMRLLLGGLLCLPWSGTLAERHMLIVISAPGTEEYGAAFQEAARIWEETAIAGDLEVQKVLQKDQLEMEVTRIRDSAPEEFWIVMIGHGTFDGKAARFNLEGPDVSAAEMAEWLDAYEEELILINSAPASAPFLVALAGEKRTIVTATKSGQQVYATQFNRFLAEAMADPIGDLNKDGQISLMEAFLLASDRTEKLYESSNRIATEHALLEDNGDGKGIRSDFFDGLRLKKRPDGEEEPDGRRARQLHLVRSSLDQALSIEQRQRRNELEREIEKLRDQRDSMEEEEYYRQAEALFLEIARIYEAVES